MKKGLLGVILSLCMLLPVSALALDLRDYVEPDIFFHDAELQALFNLKDGNQDQTSYNGSGSIWYDMEYSTLPFKWEAYAEGRGDFSRGGNDEDDSVENWNFDAWTEAKKYLREDRYREFFAFGRFDFSYRDLEGAEDDDPYAKVTAGAGYGRIFTATPLMEAVRIVEDLTKYGIIKGAVSDETYMKLAAVIHKENEYKSKYGLREYEKYWYEDMEKVFKEAGQLTDGNLKAFGVIRIQDILQDEKVIRREHGWEAKAGLGWLFSDYQGNEHDPVVSASFKYARPYGFKWQFVEEFTYSTVLVDWEFGDANHEFNNRMDLDYEISNKIDWTNMWEIAYTVVEDSEEDDILRNALETGFRFYLTNTIDLLTTLRFDHRDQGDNEDDDIVTTFYMGVAYTIF
ncbi:MAG: hypothetical protein AB7S75_25305 [Desulfococcaceae bacterium]